MSRINKDYFITIVEEGTLARAGEKLFISQSSLSQYIKRLESELGSVLFDRTESPMKLTYAGERYYDHLKKISQMEENIQRELLEISQQEAGRLKLGIALWRGACLLPDIYPAFHAKYPHAKLELFEGPSEKLEAALLRNEIDLAVMNLPHSLDYSKFACIPLFEEHLFLAVPTTMPLIQEYLKSCPRSSGIPVASMDLIRKLDLLILKPDQNLTKEVMHILGKHQITPNILLQTANLTTAINLVARGMGCTFVPEEGIHICLHPGQVTYMKLENTHHVWTLAAIFRKDAYLSALARNFIEELQTKMQNRQPTPEECV